MKKKSILSQTAIHGESSSQTAKEAIENIPKEVWIDEKRIMHCPLTISGQHLWKLETLDSRGFTRTVAPKCWACGMVDDTKITEEQV